MELRAGGGAQPKMQVLSVDMASARQIMRAGSLLRLRQPFVPYILGIHGQ
jgi:hypothetical protein